MGFTYRIHRDNNTFEKKTLFKAKKKGFDLSNAMVDVMDFSFDFFNESMDLLTPNVLEPIEIFETPVEIEKQSTELSLEEITAADQLMDELLSYQPLQVAVDSSIVMQEDKVFETLKTVLDWTQEELYAPDQPLEELLFKQPE